MKVIFNVGLALKERRLGMNLLINCNAKQIPLADGSVNCVVTSPPYYGLRSLS